MTEIEQIIQDQIKNNPQYLPQLDQHANKFYLISKGGWISEDGLIEKLAKKGDDRNIIRGNLQAILVALIVMGKAISKTESDEVIRYKITSKKEVHLEFLEKERTAILERLAWVDKKIEEFRSEEDS